MAHRNETFGRLLRGAISSIATYEGKTIPTIEEDLGSQIGISGAMVERYKGGLVPVEPERVKVLAEAAVKRSYQNREWLQRFLHAARYHTTDQLLDQLCPLGPARPRLPRVYENLPAPTYSPFVMHERRSLK